MGRKSQARAPRRSRSCKSPLVHRRFERRLALALHFLSCATIPRSGAGAPAARTCAAGRRWQ
eukprot:5983153-Pyramimonas_sp.AAC.1